ncbi:hypothetical protein ACFL1R_03130 [Candidatus Latescibacterota bacterium]
MTDDVTYNQIIIVKKNAFIKCQLIKKSFTEKGQLILILDDSQKIIFSGKSIDAFGQRDRIRELVSIAEKNVIDIPEKSIKHYAKEKGVEYVLVRLK